MGVNKVVSQEQGTKKTREQGAWKQKHIKTLGALEIGQKHFRKPGTTGLFLKGTGSTVIVSDLDYLLQSNQFVGAHNPVPDSHLGYMQ